MGDLTQITETVFINPGILYNEQNNTWLLIDMEFFFWHSKLYLTCLLRLLVRYQVEHAKRNFISTRTHVLSSIKQNNSVT